MRHYFCSNHQFSMLSRSGLVFIAILFLLPPALQKKPKKSTTTTATNVATETSQEMKIKRLLILGNNIYDKSSRPVRLDRNNVTVQIGISLFHIASIEEKYQSITFLLSVRMKWVDEYLKWNPAEYKGVEQISLPGEVIWKPDIRIANSVGYAKEKTKTNVIVSSTGSVLWMTPIYAKDSHTCDIEFFSWTYNGFQVDLAEDTTDNPSYFSRENQEWSVDSIKSRRDVQLYPCCPEPFPLVIFSISISRGPLFYIFNLILPCLLIYAVALLGFFLPIQSIEKLNLEVTILLAQVMFLESMGHIMPASATKLPLLVWLYAATMFLVAIELFSAVAVTNIYYKGKEGEELPYWLYKLLFWSNKDDICDTCGKPRLYLYRHENEMTTKLHKFVSYFQKRATTFLKAGRFTKKRPILVEPLLELQPRVLLSDDKVGTIVVPSPTPLVTLTVPKAKPNRRKARRRASKQSFGDFGDDEEENGVHSLPRTKWFRTPKGCIHILVSWQEAAERLDGYLFWLFVLGSTAIFAALFLTSPEQ